MDESDTTHADTSTASAGTTTTTAGSIGVRHPAGPGFRLLLTVLLTVLVSIALSLTAAGSASADSGATATVAWTQIGIYPRSEPSMDSSKIGPALSDGTVVALSCETEGQPVSNGYQTIVIWDQLSDGTWLPNAFLNTGTDTWTPGVPRCGVIIDHAIAYQGDHIGLPPVKLPITAALLGHYLWGGGTNVVLEPEWFSSVPGFQDEIRSLDVGAIGIWSAPANTDLFWALGTFTVSHETPNCWAMYDHYDFDPDKLSNVLYAPLWQLQTQGAREFDINASGCF